MKIPKLLPRKLTKPSSSENNDDEDDPDSEKVDSSEPQEPTETQSENQQEPVQKRADNQAILRLLGEGEKVGIFPLLVCLLFLVFYIRVNNFSSCRDAFPYWH